MQNDTIYHLEYIQMMMFMVRLQEMRRANPYFKNEIVEKFEMDMKRRTTEIAWMAPAALRSVPNADKYPVSSRMIEYLTALTGVDVFDEDMVRLYTPMIEKSSNEAKAKILTKQLMKEIETSLIS